MKKLNLEQLKVKSFVTSLEAGSEETVKGGRKVPTGGVCPSNPCTVSNENDCDIDGDNGGGGSYVLGCK